MTMVQWDVRVQTRTGSNYLTTALGDWWGPITNSIGDPRVLYDPYAQRWIATAQNKRDNTLTNYWLLIGVSMTSDPTGAWNRRAVKVESPFLPDHPVIGFNTNWIVVTINIFPEQTNHYSHIYVFDKHSLYASNNPTPTAFTNVAGVGICPVSSYDNSITNLYLVQDYNGNTNSQGYVRMLEIRGTVGSEVLVTNSLLASPQTWTNGYRNFSADNLAPQKGTTNRIHTFDSRIASAVYRNGSIWFAHTVFLPASSVTRCAVQWWEVRTNGFVRQRGRIDDPGGTNFYAFPSIAVNRFNDVLIGYNRFSSNQYPSANYSFRAYHDALNTLRTDRVFRVGDTQYVFSITALNRWGDYSATVVDSVNDADMWTIQEYAALSVPPEEPEDPEDLGARWGTWWGKVNVERPTNDHFTTARVLSGSQGSATNTNRRATRESGEPNHAGQAGGASLWYNWTAPHSGQVAFDTVGSGFSDNGGPLDALLAVYTGASVTNLTLITSDDNSAGNQASRVVFTATSNTTYRIAVDGLNGLTAASVLLNWSQSFVPVILSPPQGTNVVADFNEDAIFNVLAMAVTTPLRYQWRCQGTNISDVATNLPNATNASHTVVNVQTNHVGHYSVVVTNSSGSVTSAPATLFVHGNSAARLSLVTFTNAQFRFHISGLTNRAYRIDSSTNLNSATNWQPVFTNVVSYWYTNLVATNDPQRFYRAVTNQ